MPKQKKKTNEEFLDETLEEKEAPAKPASDDDDLDEELLDLDEADDDDIEAGADDEEVGY